MCVSLTTLEATLIYSAKNGNQWTANGILFLLKKTQILQIGSFDSETAVKLTALYHTSYGHAHFILKVQHKLRHRNTASKTAICMNAGDMGQSSSSQGYVR